MHTLLHDGPDGGKILDLDDIRHTDGELAVLSYHTKGYYILSCGPRPPGAPRRATFRTHPDQRFEVTRYRESRPRLSRP
jgi:hypothetical protein